MKYIVVLGDGMADDPRSELGGQTPLQYAATPNMDLLAAGGEMGLVQTVPPGFPPGSDVANLSVFGYAPEKYYTGRSPLEAVSMGVELAQQDLALRCNLVTLSETETDYDAKQMIDYSAGEITSAEAKELMQAVAETLGGPEICFYPGISYRHLMVWPGGPAETVLTPPHDISGRTVGEYLPRGEGGDFLLSLMRQSYAILHEHPVNGARREKGLRPANSIWLWGQGKKPALPHFKELYGLSGAVISAVDLIMGIGLCAGLNIITVPGATGNIHTNFSGKARAALDALAHGAQFVYLHVEAPDEAGHQGDTDTKVRAIEAIDSQILGVLLPELAAAHDAYRILLLPDHPTPLEIKTHTADPVPYIIWDNTNSAAGGKTYCEASAAATGNNLPGGPALMRRFLDVPGGK